MCCVRKEKNRVQKEKQLQNYMVTQRARVKPALIVTTRERSLLFHCETLLNLVRTWSRASTMRCHVFPSFENTRV